MSAEEQVTGTRYAGKVEGWAYIPSNFHMQEEDAVVAVALDSGLRLQVPMLPAEAAKVRKGDNVYVSVEITREP